MSALPLIKPMNYMKTNAAKLEDELGGNTMIITQNGHPTLAIQSIDTYKQQQNDFALLQLLLQSNEDIEKGRISNLNDFLDTL